MSFMDDFDESLTGLEVDLSRIPGFEPEEPEPVKAKVVATEEEPDPKYVSRKDYETLQSQLGDLKDLMIQQNARATAAPQIQYVQPAPQQQNPETLRAQLEQQYYADPVGFTTRMAQQTAQNQFGNDIGAVRETLAQQAVQNFKSSKMGEPAFKAAQAHFDTQVGKAAGQLSKLTPQQMGEFLDFSYKAALGTLYGEMIVKQQKNGARSGNAPAYGGSSTGGGVPQRAVSTSNDADPRLIKYLGLSDDDFAGIND